TTIAIAVSMQATSVLQNRVDVLARQLAAAVQSHQLDQECESVHLAAEAFHQVGGRARSPARSQEVVDDQHALPRANRVFMNLQRVAAVFELVAGADAPRRQLPRLAHRREAGPDAIRDRRAENEPAALDGDNDLDTLILERKGKRIDGRAEARWILQQRRDVVEENPGLGEVRNMTDFFFKLVHRYLTLNPAPP